MKEREKSVLLHKFQNLASYLVEHGKAASLTHVFAVFAGEENSTRHREMKKAASCEAMDR